MKTTIRNEESSNRHLRGIDILNEDCLLSIFKCLGTIDKMNLASVCKRWNVISSNCWKNVNHIYIDDQTVEINKFEKISFTTEQNVKLFLASLMRKCGKYVKILINECYRSYIYDVILEYCTNLEFISCYQLDDETNFELKNMNSLMEIRFDHTEYKWSL